MKVNELIKALSELPQDLDVFHLDSEDGGLREISDVLLAEPTEDEAKEIVGEKFVFIE